MKKQRESNFELLRIICMFMVVLNHCISFSGLNLEVGTINWYITHAVYAIVYVAVNIFVLISGYFMCTGKLTIKKVATIWLTSTFYTVSIYLLLCLFNSSVVFNIKLLFKNFLILTFNHYWFITAYIIMLLLSPILNFAIKSMNKYQHLMACVLLFFTFSVIPQLTLFVRDFTGVKNGYNWIWFIVLYMIGSYIRLYVQIDGNKNKKYLLAYLLISLVICGNRYFSFAFLNGNGDSLLYAYNSVTMFASSVCLFLFFKGIKIKDGFISKSITKISGLTLAVYLIHMQQNLIYILWDATNCSEYSNSPFMMLYCILCSLIIFIGCCLIEKVRVFVFNKTHINAVLYKTCDFVENKIKCLFCKI